jgi:ribonuclease-3
MDEIEKKINYSFKDKTLLELAFTHRSYTNENRMFLEHNERLEFLGDAVLDLLVVEYLYQKYRDKPEGELSFLRSRLVDAASCASYIEAIGVTSFLRLGRGENRNVGRGRTSIHADLFEALLGAVYLDGGLESAREVFLKGCAVLVDEILREPLHNWKALLQDYCQKYIKKPLEYRILDEKGPEHKKQFQVVVLIEERALGVGFGTSKKEAEQKAAMESLKILNAIPE